MGVTVLVAVAAAAVYAHLLSDMNALIQESKHLQNRERNRAIVDYVKTRVNCPETFYHVAIKNNMPATPPKTKKKNKGTGGSGTSVVDPSSYNTDLLGVTYPLTNIPAVYRPKLESDLTQCSATKEPGGVLCAKAVSTVPVGDKSYPVRFSMPVYPVYQVQAEIDSAEGYIGVGSFTCIP